MRTSTAGSSDRPTPFVPARDGVRVAVRVRPRARRQRIEGVVEDGAGGRALKVAVTAAPEGGKANAAVMALLARAWRVPKTSLHVAQGAADRRKIVHVAGETEALLARLTAWLAERDG